MNTQMPLLSHISIMIHQHRVTLVLKFTLLRLQPHQLYAECIQKFSRMLAMPISSFDAVLSAENSTNTLRSFRRSFVRSARDVALSLGSEVRTEQLDDVLKVGVESDHATS